MALKVVDDFILIDISKIEDFDLPLGLMSEKSYKVIDDFVIIDVSKAERPETSIQ